MKTNRRRFIRLISVAGTALFTGIPQLFAKKTRTTQSVTILHTNDVHSQIDPFPAEHPKFSGKGGFAPRMALIESIRREMKHVWLFDCGDIFQGTPYFNFYKGKLEIELMNRMKVDVATLGNHEFDNGTHELSKRIAEANFPFVNANYQFSHQRLVEQVKPYQILELDGIKAAIVGLGVPLDGLVNEVQHGGTTCLDPIATGNQWAKKLKEEMGCNLTIVLSHMGYKMSSGIDDLTLAAESTHIDLILGGHTHTFLEQPVAVPNKHGKNVWINQVGFAGIHLGRIDLLLEKQPNGFQLVACNGTAMEITA